MRFSFPAILVFSFIFSLLSISLAINAQSAEVPAWINEVRSAHPRLFLNNDIIQVLRRNANGREKALYQGIKKRVDDAMSMRSDDIQFVIHEGILVDVGVVYFVTGEEKYKRQALTWLDRGVDHLETLYAEEKALGWYSFQRMGLLMIYDWFHGELSKEQRQDYAKRLMDHIEKINSGKIIKGENRYGFPRGGFYGTNNLYWYAGITFYGEGVDDVKAKAWLKRGWSDHMKLAAHRRKVAGDDGGLSAAVPGYAVGAYPRAEWNFLHTCKSAFNYVPTKYFDYLPMLLNWLAWTIIHGEDGLYDYGFGDTGHATNKLGDLKHVHLSQIRYFFHKDFPEYGRVAQHLMNINPSNNRGTYFWGDLYALLLESETEPVAPMEPDNFWPKARYFESFGQFFMRSGVNHDDTYIMFLAGATEAKHKHFDEGHFTIFKHGFQALDTGTRDQKDPNSQSHITEYYSRTIAHNSLLIKMPSEEFPHHWGRVPNNNDGGQNRKRGSKILAFETNEFFTNVVADLTPVYSSKKVVKVTRQFLYLLPNHIVLLDRVKSTNRRFSKTWLLHSQSEPRKNGMQWSTINGNGIIHVKTLLPVNAVYRVIGGAGNEFDVNGTNYPVSKTYIDSFTKKKLGRLFRDMQIGHWRIEVSPDASNRDDVFLHVIEVGDRIADKTMTPVSMTESDQYWYISIELDQSGVEITLDKTDALAGSVKTKEKTYILKKTIQEQKGLALNAK